MIGLQELPRVCCKKNNIVIGGEGLQLKTNSKKMTEYITETHFSMDLEKAFNKLEIATPWGTMH